MIAAKGSRRWLQVAVNHRPELLDEPLRKAASLPPDAAVEWLSPLACEDFKEYRDDDAIRRLRIELGTSPLKDFWPPRGPCWDGLARASTGDVFLVEAKAHVGEMFSGRSRASSEASTARIAASLREVRRAIAPGAGEADWTGAGYQHANRLAHLHLLRERNGIPAHLVLVYFLNAADVKGPSDRAEYERASAEIESRLGVRQTTLSRYVHKVYVDVRDLPADVR